MRRMLQGSVQWLGMVMAEGVSSKCGVFAFLFEREREKKREKERKKERERERERETERERGVKMMGRNDISCSNIVKMTSYSRSGSEVSSPIRSKETTVNEGQLVCL